jgi:hypothetical protein
MDSMYEEPERNELQQWMGVGQASKSSESSEEIPLDDDTYQK